MEGRLHDAGDDTMKVSGSTVIHRPVEEVFKFVATDFFQNRSKWSTDTNTLELQKISEGPMGVGTIGRDVAEYPDGRYASHLLVTEYEPDRKMVIEDSFRYDDSHPSRLLASTDPYKIKKFSRTYSFEPVPGGTKITFATEGYADIGGLYRLLVPFHVFWATKASQGTLYKVADLLEGPSRARAIKGILNRMIVSRSAYFVLLLLLVGLYIASPSLQWPPSWTQALSTLMTISLVIWTIAIFLQIAFVRRLNR